MLSSLKQLKDKTLPFERARKLYILKFGNIEFVIGGIFTVKFGRIYLRKVTEESHSRIC